MACSDCKSGFNWEGQPIGAESSLAGASTYVVGDSQKAAILLIPDIFGYKLVNIRLLADHFSKEASATVYVPDFYDGDIIDHAILDDVIKQQSADLTDWVERNGREKRWPQVKACAQALKDRYPKVAAIGYCWGGWACLQLASDTALIDAISTAHPAMMEKSDFDKVKVPVQLLAPENDFTFTPELKQYSLEALPKTGVQWEYVYFAGYNHGFASRGDPSDPSTRPGLERAKRCAVNFFNEFLH